MLRIIVILASVVFGAAAAFAQERITNFDVAIDVRKNGDIEVAETIAVIAEGNDIQRGIYRDLPRVYLQGAARTPYAYDVVSVTRDGKREKYAVEKDARVFRIRIGDADVLLEPGPHTYVLTYGVKNQVRYFNGYDEVYWNATGNFWKFPIETARARVTLPGDAAATQTEAYTGREGESGRDFRYSRAGGGHAFVATRPLAPGEGMTVAIGFAKGVVDPPSAADARDEWWARNVPTALLIAAMAAIGAFYVWAWNRIGRDPPKGPVFARYEPPQGYSPAAVHQIYHRGLSGHAAFIATLVNLGVKKRLRIEPDLKRKTTTLYRLDAGDGDIPETDRRLEQNLFLGGDVVSLDGKYDAGVTRANEQFQRYVGVEYGKPYFRWNVGFLIIAVILSGLAVLGAAALSVDWSPLRTGLVAALAAMAITASYFLPAATRKGQDIRTEIEGFRLYLKTAEQLQLNAVKVGSEAPPPMTVERYERFLPYAVALGVEKPWTEHFETLLPKESADYRPGWTSSSYSGGRGALAGFNNALVSTLSSGVSSALPKSSSSSGSGGGGSSGGGGGGGGGGGW